MTKIVSVHQEHEGEQVTLKSLDKWLSDILIRVATLEKSNKEKDKKIEELEDELKKLKNGNLIKINPKPLFSELFSDKKQDLNEVEANLLAGVTRECREIKKRRTT
jgi:exosome complex RNA-binding protein Rrp4